MWREQVQALAASWTGVVVLLAALLAWLCAMAAAGIAVLEARRQRRRQRLLDRLSLFEGDVAPPISVLVHAHEVQLDIAQHVRGLLALRYPALEIIVVNDGSIDTTAAVLRSAFGMKPARRTPRARVPQGRVRGVYASPDTPQLLLVDLAHLGRARALNVALAYARSGLVITSDVGAAFERDALLHLALPFFDDASVLVVGGVTRGGVPLAGDPSARPSAVLPEGTLRRAETVELLRSMLTVRLGWSLFDCLFLAPGAPVLMARDAVMAVGGYRPGATAVDADLLMRMQVWAARLGHKLAVRFAANAIAWVEPASTPLLLARRRAREQRGLAESLWLNRELLLEARFAAHHGFAYLFQIVVEVVGPLAECVGAMLLLALVVAGNLAAPFALMYLSIVIAGGTLLSFAAIGLERIACPRFRGGRSDFEALAWAALIENFGVRQLVAVARVAGLGIALMSGVAAFVSRPRQVPSVAHEARVERAA